MKTIQHKIIFTEKASRIEMLYRIVWAIFAGIVLWVFSLVAVIAWVIQFFYILVYKKRNMSLNNFLKIVVVQRYRLNAYLFFLTDERPPIVPEMNV